jgi:hypothetical protein
MSTDYQSYLKELDTVLQYIISKGGSITDSEKYFREVKDGTVAVIPNQNDKYNLAYVFLTSEGYITKTEGGYRTTYKGLLKTDINSFQNTYKREKRKDDLSKRFWILMPIIGIASIVLSLAVFTNSLFKWW